MNMAVVSKGVIDMVKPIILFVKKNLALLLIIPCKKRMDDRLCHSYRKKNAAKI